MMYLRPASWAMRTASAIGRVRTEASLTPAERKAAAEQRLAYVRAACRIRPRAPSEEAAPVSA